MDTIRSNGDIASEISELEAGLEPTPFEIQEAAHRKVQRTNDLREILRLRRNNRRKGYPEPKPGDKLYVSAARGISFRRRAGLNFENGTRAEVLVVNIIDPDDGYFGALETEGPIKSMTEEELRRAQQAGAYWCSVHDAERIFEDSDPKIGGLYVSSMPGATREQAAMEEELRLAKEERELLRKELDKMRAAQREARQSAPESTDGRPSRLIAARKAAAAAPDSAGAAPDTLLDIPPKE